MTLKKILIQVICLAILSGCGHGKKETGSGAVQQSPVTEISGNISVSGAYALAPVAKQWAEEFMKIHPGVKIEITANGTGNGIKDLIDKKSQLAMISRPLTEDETNAGIWTVAVAKDGVAPIVNSSNPYLDKLLSKGLSPNEFQKIYTSDKPLKWSEFLDNSGNENIKVFVRSEESGAASVLAKFLFRNAPDLKGIIVNSDDEMVKSIQENKFGLGFCNFSYAFGSPEGGPTENIQVIPFDLDFDNNVDRKEIPFKNIEEAHRSVWLGIYPDVLCRNLALCSLEKPTDPAITEFIKYILTEGQENVKGAGLCSLNNVYIRNGLESLR